MLAQTTAPTIKYIIIFNILTSKMDKPVKVVIMIVSFTLCVVIIMTVATLLVGLFNNKVDNGEIFKMLTPAFSTIIGAFVGILGGLSINDKKKDK
mgnify:CR=1 FL=1